jgi:chromate transport protein ChrA
MRGQAGFWDVDERYVRLSEVDDPLEKLNAVVPWDVFRKPLARALKAVIATLAVFLPGFLILIGVLPFWDRFRAMAPAQSLMQGANAAVVGILGAALYSPVFTSAIADLRDFALALACFVLLMAWKAPPWVVVVVAAVGGVGLALLG